MRIGSKIETITSSEEVKINMKRAFQLDTKNKKVSYKKNEKKDSRPKH